MALHDPAVGSELPVAAEGWLAHLVVERGRSPRTIAAYRSDLRRFLDWLGPGRTLGSVDRRDVAGWEQHLRAEGFAASTCNRMLSSVRGLFAHLSAEGLVAADPTDGVETPRLPDPLPRALPEADVLAILEVVAAASEGPHATAVDVRDLALLELLYGTGARVSEVCGLGFGDVDLDGAVVRLLGKRSKERIVPIGVPARRALEQWFDHGRPEMVPARPSSRNDADAVFLGVRGRRLSRQAVWEVLRRRAREAGVTDEVHPHVLRHSCATHMLDHGADIRTVGELLGHASVSTTQIYTRVATDRLFDAWRTAHPRAERTTARTSGGDGGRNRGSCGS